MSTESHDTSEERGYGDGDKEFLNKMALCSPDAPRVEESTFAAYTKCDDLIRYKMQRTPSYVGYGGIQQFQSPKFVDRISHDKLEHLYICKINESKLNSGRKICSEEQPLDFSRKPISSVRKDESPQKFLKLASNPTITFQENSANSSDSVDNSCDDEEKPERFTVYSHANRKRSLKVLFHSNNSENAVFAEREEDPRRISNRTFLQCSRRNEYKRNGLKAANSSGSEDEFHSEYSVNNSRDYEPNGDPSQLESSYAAHLSAEEKKSPQSQLTITDVTHVSNHHSENGTNISTEKNDRFHIQGILSRDNLSTPKEEYSETDHQINNSITQQRTSPHSTSNHLSKEENLPSRSISPSHTVSSPPGFNSPSQSTHFPPSGFPFGAADRLYESNRMITPYMQTVFPPYHMSTFLNHNSPKEASDYSRLYSYRPGTIQPPFNPMYSQQYQQALFVGQDQQKQKKQRPFKDIDPSILIQHVPTVQNAAALSLVPSPSSSYNSPTIRYTECNGSTAMDTSPQRLSPDSPCIINGSSGNESLQQGTNDECGRKKVRRIPPEEKDEKYLEKRKKNNMAAKKSREARRTKEDMLAVSCKELVHMKITLETENKILHKNKSDLEENFKMVVANLISFRGKCEGRTKELFEETFKLYLPQH